MPWWRRSAAGDDGSASLEFITAGLLLLVPLVYLVLTLSAIESGSYAVEAAARQGVRVFVQAPSEAEAQARAQQAVRFALADYGVDASAATVRVTCSPRPSRCLTRLGSVRVDVRASVPLPLMPSVLAVHVPLSVGLESGSVEKVSRFWGAP